MERDFMGIGGKEGFTVAKEGARASCKDAAFLTRPTLQRPYPSLQQYMPSKAARDDRTRKNALDQISSSCYQATSPMFLSQKKFNLDIQAPHPVPMATYPSQGAGAFGTLLHYSNDGGVLFPVYPKHPIPVTQNNSFYKGHKAVTRPNAFGASSMQQHQFGGNSVGSGPVVGSKNSAFAERISTRTPPATAQLTIFYGGMVNVYDNVPLEKAKKIMFLAENGSDFTPNTADVINQVPFLGPVKVMASESINNKSQNPPQTSLMASSPCSGFSSHSASHSPSGSSTRDGIKMRKTTALSAHKNQEKCPNTAAQEFAPSDSGSTPMTRAVPMARKASLARFLEKRKERITNIAPYSTKICTESSSMGLEATCSPEKSAKGSKMPPPSSSSATDRSWHPDAFKCSSHDVRFPNTNLEI